jgi:hypothetical protein
MRAQVGAAAAAAGEEGEGGELAALMRSLGDD